MDNDSKYKSIKLYNSLCQVFGSKNVVKSRRYMYFAVEKLTNSGYQQTIPSGSRAEGLELNGSDFDIMKLFKNFHVYEKLSDTNISEDSIKLLMEYDETKLGYTRLRLLNKVYNNKIYWNKKYYDMGRTTIDYWYEGIKYLSSSGVRETLAARGSTPHGPCQILKSKTSFEREILLGFRCKDWISLANSWTSRKRSVWPSSELINEIKQYGVLFVPVGCKTSKHEDIEWRISFAVAEKHLIDSFTHTQFLCYAMIKTIVSDIIKKRHADILCSYFVKNIMLWLSEEYDPSYWVETNLTQCIQTCLNRLSYCVQYQICQHYFIPEINFFEGRFSGKEHATLLLSLYEIKFSGLNALLHTKTFQNFRTLYRPITQLKDNETVMSSAVSPIAWISGLISRAACRSLFSRALKCVARCTTLSAKRIIVYIMAAESYHRVSTNEIFRVFIGPNCNKYIYKQYKSIFPDIMISTRGDCVSGWCMLASLFYKLKNYNTCMFIIRETLGKCTPNKLKVSFQTQIRLPKHLQNILSKCRSVCNVIMHYFLMNLIFYSPTLLPTEMPRSVNNKPTGGIVISPDVYLYFLDFLCAHHMKKNRAKKHAFGNLEWTARGHTGCLATRQILEVANTMLHLS